VERQKGELRIEKVTGRVKRDLFYGKLYYLNIKSNLMGKSSEEEVFIKCSGTAEKNHPKHFQS
jgi:hypothetical protein